MGAKKKRRDISIDIELPDFRIAKLDKKDILKPIKMSRREKELIEAKAALYAGGNLSRWLRWAAIHYEPSPDEIDWLLSPLSVGK
jgi:hypothetical protein